jgi:UDP-N-acetylmuramoyl-tripeptide--D-alanyl-D-alanine ligase
MRFTVAELAASLGAPASGDAELSGVAVDSRNVRPGDLFVAIRGARVDGHDFAGKAAAAGARAVLAERHPDNLRAEFPVVIVRDVVAALRRFASTLKRRTGFRLAAITGSAGKTTTKEFTAAILARRFAVAKTPGNQNSQIGFPMSVINLPGDPNPKIEWLVGEMGLSEPGDLATLSRAFEPDVAALLLVAPAHLEFFSSMDALAQAKAEILEGLRPGGTFVANADDPRVAAIAARFEGRVVRFGRSAAADVSARGVESGAEGSRFLLVTPEGEARVELPVPGPHQVDNFLAASAIGTAIGVTPDDCAAAARELRAAEHRGEIKPLASGAVILDDAYNANPASMRAALEALATLATLPGSRRIAVLGDMLELGADEDRWHRETGAAALGRADVLVCVGPRARGLAAGAIAAGFPEGQVRRVETAEEAAEALRGTLGKGDVVLFKASHSVGLERAVALLTDGVGAA